jgi:hypothetical protein
MSGPKGAVEPVNVYIYIYIYVRFEVSAILTVKITSFWNLTFIVWYVSVDVPK